MILCYSNLNGLRQCTIKKIASKLIILQRENKNQKKKKELKV